MESITTIEIVDKIISQYAKHYPMTLTQKINVRNQVIYHLKLENNILYIPFLCLQFIYHYLNNCPSKKLIEFDYALYREIINKYVPPTNNIWLLFDTFLKKNRIYRKFYKEYKKSQGWGTELLILGVRPEKIIRKAFIWSSTEQGGNYWSNINQVFEKFIHENTLRLSQDEIDELNSYIVNNKLNHEKDIGDIAP